MKTHNIMVVPNLPMTSPRSWQVANKVIRHARNIKYAYEHDMRCPDCHLFPEEPVTGPCGHTRCTGCIQQKRACPCGSEAPETLHVNILIKDLIVKMVPEETLQNGAGCLAVSNNPESPEQSTSGASAGGPVRANGSARRQSRLVPYSLTDRQPVSPQSRFKYARELCTMGMYKEAASHLAHAAASSKGVARNARQPLTETITNLRRGLRDTSRIMREVYRSVREQSAPSWLRPEDLECIICYEVLRSPVTTPCGHTFCRVCLEGLCIYTMKCALCARRFDDFSIINTPDTSFLCAALTAVAPLMPSPGTESEFVPLFACTVAYPGISCPLVVGDPSYWVMIRRVLESGSRLFGMVAYERDRTYSDYGTILEVRDCVQCEDGRTILSTVGVTRFRVIERAVRDGCHMARIQEFTDIIPTVDIVVLDLKLLAQQISCKASLWMSTLNKTLVSDIESAFGKIPPFHQEEMWWENPNGPEWLWWLIAILPLKSEIQVLMLSTKHLLKRMTAVSRTLEVMDHVAITPALVPAGCDRETEIYTIYENNSAREN